jgi:putative membrane protein
MPEASRDPRVYLAAERTLLAWLRTGIGIMAFGFVVARFGLYLRLLRTQAGGTVPAPDLSPWLGAGLLGLGVVALVGGALQFRRFCRGLAPSDLPSPRAPWLPLALTWALALVGMALCAALFR